MPRPADGYSLSINGELVKVPGVSSVIAQVGWGGEALQDWANWLGRRGIKRRAEMRRMADIGTAVHEYADAKVLGKPMGPVPRLKGEQIQQARSAASAWAKWHSEHEVRAKVTELALTCPYEDDYRLTGFGGTFDFLGWVDGVPTLGDFKTSNKCYGKVLLQLAGYLRLIEHEIAHGQVTDGSGRLDDCIPQQVAVWRLDKTDGECEPMRWPVDSEAVKDAREGFRLCRGLYQIEASVNKAMGKRKSSWDRKELQ